ncbi:MAG: hypothetical protein ACPGWR_06890 [Ardenticatenaceae bacterium]
MAKTIQQKINSIEFDMLRLIRSVTDEAVYTYIYGAYHIHPKHLTIHIIVETEAEEKRLRKNSALIEELRSILAKHKYPYHARKHVYIGFTAQETIDEEAYGNSYHYFK